MASSLFRTNAVFAASRTCAVPRATRSLHLSRALLAAKESTLHNENRAEEADHHKQDQLRKQKEGKGQWKDELASDSESIIKADRDELSTSKQSIQDLQNESARLAEKEKK